MEHLGRDLAQRIFQIGFMGKKTDKMIIRPTADVLGMSQSNRRTFISAGVGASVAMVLAGRGYSLSPPSQGGVLPEYGNPILPGLGVCDPQIRVFGKHIYLYATHDASPENRQFHMENWWVWRTDDLVHWEQVSVLHPEQTYLRRPFTQCWATDAATRNGKYYFYFSAGPKDIGVVVGPTPSGPWTDPIGKPMIADGLTPVEERDPGILMDVDGVNYIIFGTWDFYIARLADDMVSLAEAPRLIHLDHKAGPYGEGKTDDKPFLHRRGDIYYLSWGCFYAVSESPYGPYRYKGSVIDPILIDPGLRSDRPLHDRHASFFEFQRQWYFACNDKSLPGTSDFFRNTDISYVHYRANGDIAPVRLDRVGVGRYDAAKGKIEAEDYFKLIGNGTVGERADGTFEVRDLRDRSALMYPNVEHVPHACTVVIRVSSAGPHVVRIEVREGGGRQLGLLAIPNTGSWTSYQDVHADVKITSPTPELTFIIHGGDGECVRIDSWRIVGRGNN